MSLELTNEKTTAKYTSCPYLMYNIQFVKQMLG